MNRCRMQFGSRCLSPVAGCTTRRREKKKKQACTLIPPSSKWGNWGHPHKWISFCGERGAWHGWKASGSCDPTLPGVDVAGGDGASSAGGQGRADLQWSHMEGDCVPRAVPPAGTLCWELQPGSAEPRGTLCGGAPTAAEEPTVSSGNKTERAGGTCTRKDFLRQWTDSFTPESLLAKAELSPRLASVCC